MDMPFCVSQSSKRMLRNVTHGYDKEVVSYWVSYWVLGTYNLEGILDSEWSSLYHKHESLLAAWAYCPPLMETREALEKVVLIVFYILAFLHAPCIMSFLPITRKESHMEKELYHVKPSPCDILQPLRT